MRYFTFNPLVHSKDEAFELAEPHLENDFIVHVANKITSSHVRGRPEASVNTYLVRVEPDNSLRVVGENFEEGEL